MVIKGIYETQELSKTSAKLISNIYTEGDRLNKYYGAASYTSYIGLFDNENISSYSTYNPISMIGFPTTWAVQTNLDAVFKTGSEHGTASIKINNSTVTVDVGTLLPDLSSIDEIKSSKIEKTYSLLNAPIINDKRTLNLKVKLRKGEYTTESATWIDVDENEYNITLTGLTLTKPTITLGNIEDYSSILINSIRCRLTRSINDYSITEATFFWKIFVDGVEDSSCVKSSSVGTYLIITFNSWMIGHTVQVQAGYKSTYTQEVIVSTTTDEYKLTNNHYYNIYVKTASGAIRRVQNKVGYKYSESRVEIDNIYGVDEEIERFREE